ncbi:MAG: MBL fold metallo-hydrolase [Terrimicrobiaceae bacterium]|nr:MBL fold metallo-hydrolase [Terrimicrobiaceae bacterium]
MIRPVQQDAALLADIAAAEPEALHIWWLGQSGFLVKWRKQFLLLDPYLSDSLTRKYAATDKPHTRMTGRVIAPEKLDFVSVATSSHNHTDHLDAETLQALWRANPGLRLVLPEANIPFARERLGVASERLVGVNDGSSATAGGFTFHGVPAAHNALDRDPQGRCLYMGFVVQAGPWAIYHSGDTLPYEGMVDLLRPFSIDLALLPINGNIPERRVAGNLDGGEAATLAHQIGARLVVPCHYDMFDFNTASPDIFVAACERLDQPHRVLRAGERLTLRNDE